MLMDWKNIVKMSTLPKAVYRFSAISVSILMSFFIEIEKTILKFVWNHTRPQITETILRKTSRRHHAPCFQTILQRYSNQNSLVKLSLCGQLIHGKGAKNTHGEKIVSSVNIVGNWTSLISNHRQN